MVQVEQGQPRPGANIEQNPPLREEVQLFLPIELCFRETKVELLPVGSALWPEYDGQINVADGHNGRCRQRQ
jgi:hypothetical protein